MAVALLDAVLALLDRVRVEFLDSCNGRSLGDSSRYSASIIILSTGSTNRLFKCSSHSTEAPSCGFEAQRS